MKYLLFFLLSVASLSVGAQTMQTVVAGPNMTFLNNVLDANPTTANNALAKANEAAAAAASNQAAISVLQASTNTAISPRTIVSSSYTVVPADNGGTLLFSNTCTVSFSPSIKPPFKCDIQQQAGQVTFSGSNIISKFSYKRMQTQNAWVTVRGTGNGIVSLGGDLKY